MRLNTNLMYTSKSVFINYWMEQEKNELLTKNMKTFDCDLPKPLLYLTPSQQIELWRLMQQHKKKMLQNKLQIEFQLRFYGIKNMDNEETQKELQQYKKQIYNLEHCPCCQIKDYFTDDLEIISQ